MFNKPTIAALWALIICLTTSCSTSDVGITGTVPFTPPSDVRPKPVDNSYTSKINYNEKVDLLSVFFDKDRSNVRSDSTAIDIIASFMLNNPSSTIRIEGNASDTGRSKYNYNLGLKRAKNVRTALIAKGVNPTSLIILSNGDKKPAFNNLYENRRVDLYFTSTAIPDGYQLVKNKIPAIVNIKTDLSVTKINPDDNDDLGLDLQ